MASKKLQPITKNYTQQMDELIDYYAELMIDNKRQKGFKIDSDLKYNLYMVVDRHFRKKGYEAMKRAYITAFNVLPHPDYQHR